MDNFNDKNEEICQNLSNHRVLWIEGALGRHTTKQAQQCP